MLIFPSQWFIIFVASLLLIATYYLTINVIVLSVIFIAVLKVNNNKYDWKNYESANRFTVCLKISKKSSETVSGFDGYSTPSYFSRSSGNVCYQLL